MRDDPQNHFRSTSLVLIADKSGCSHRKHLQSLPLIFLLAMLMPSFAQAQLQDDFESGPTRWRLGRDDAGTRVVQSQRISTMPRSGISSEMIEVSVGLQGTYVHLIYPLQERLAVIDELTVSLWVRAAASGMRPAFRVVFPRTAHPATSQPLTTLLYGTPSLGGGQWSMIEVKQPVRLLEDQRRVLKTQFGPAVDLRGAYVDAIILDIFNGAGNTKLQTDDLSIEGIVSVDRIPEQLFPVSVGPGTPSESRSSETAPQIIAERARDLRASVPRWLQYRGESLDWLASMGVNGIVVDQTPSVTLLNEANRVRIGVIAPPPHLMPNDADAAAWQAVHGWSLGWALDGTQLEASRDTTVRLNKLPLSFQRPTLVEAMEAYGPYGRLADLLAVPIPLPTTLRDNDEAGRILQTSVQPLRGRTVPLASIMLEPLGEWQSQRDRIAQVLYSNAASIEPYDLGQARLQMMRSIGHGVRGWYFRSLSPLDSEASVNRLRTDSLRALTAELNLMAPWIQSGEPAVAIPVDLKSGYTGFRIAMPRSQLILLTRRGDYDQLVIPADPLENLPLTLSRQEQTTQVYRISRGRLESIPTQPSVEGWKLNVPNPSAVEMLVVTEDPRAIGYLQSKLAELSSTITESRLEIANQSLQIAQMTLVAEQIPAKEQAWRDIATAQSNLRSATQYLSRSDLLRCLASTDAATTLADRITRQSWQRAIVRFPSPTSSPLTASKLSLPLHWELDRIVSNRMWESRTLSNANLDDLPSMLAAGWSIDRRLEDRVSSEAMMVGGSGPDGSPSLVLDAKSIDTAPISGGYAGASMRIESPAIEVPADSLVHIQGLVRVVSCSGEPQSGLLVYDRYGGPALGQLLNSTTGDANTWQRISLYRMATDAQGCRILFELRGAARVMIDQLQVETMMPTPVPNFPTTPLPE